MNEGLCLLDGEAPSRNLRRSHRTSASKDIAALAVAMSAIFPNNRTIEFAAVASIASRFGCRNLLVSRKMVQIDETNDDASKDGKNCGNAGYC